MLALLLCPTRLVGASDVFADAMWCSSGSVCLAVFSLSVSLCLSVSLSRSVCLSVCLSLALALSVSLSLSLSLSLALFLSLSLFERDSRVVILFGTGQDQHAHRCSKGLFCAWVYLMSICWSLQSGSGSWGRVMHAVYPSRCCITVLMSLSRSLCLFFLSYCITHDLFCRKR